MIKFTKHPDIKGSLLLLSFTSVGLTGNFASSLLLNNNNFQNIGFLFSQYLLAYAGFNQQTGGVLLNGQVYFNEEKKILLINFHAGVSHHNRNKFSQEIVELFQQYTMRGIVIYGGSSHLFLNDELIRNKNVEVYFLTNDQSFEGERYSMKNFESLVKLEDKKKPFEEVKYLEGIGTAKHLIKFLSKKNVTFHYFFAYSAELFDPLAGMVVYNRLTLLLGIQTETVNIPKYSESLPTFLEGLEKKYKFEPIWRLFLKE
jgi:predicted ATP-grasp superfamily ATP-dependent carboligase